MPGIEIRMMQLDEVPNLSLEEADEFLKGHNAVGILIGGFAYDMKIAKHKNEHKDLDILIIKGAEEIRDQTGFDIFLPNKEGVPVNRGENALPYHIHYVGKELAPGLYTVPAEVIHLTEAEVQTRRNKNRPLNDDYSEESFKENCFSEISLEDIVLEFPGDMGWIGNNLPLNVQINLVVRNEGNGAGKRTFITFKKDAKSNLPSTAFPNRSYLRAPDIDIDGDSLFKERVLSEREMYALAEDLIQKGYTKEGFSIIMKSCPNKLDNFDFFAYTIMLNDPLAFYDFLCKWLVLAKEKNFMSLFLFNPGLSKYGINFKFAGLKDDIFDDLFRNLYGEILEKYGVRYIEILKKIFNFRIELIFEDCEIKIPDGLKDTFRRLIQHLESCVDNKDIGDFKETFEIDSNDIEIIVKKDLYFSSDKSESSLSVLFYELRKILDN